MPEIQVARIDYKTLLGRIREGTADKEEYFLVHQIPHARPLADLVGKGDVSWLLEAIDSSDAARRAAAWRLTKRIGDDPRISERLQEWWGKDILPIERDVLLWRLLQFPGLPVRLHREICGWVQSEPERFLNSLLEHLRPLIDEGQDFFEIMRESIQDKGNPATKLWIYAVAARLFGLANDRIKEAENLLGAQGCPRLHESEIFQTMSEEIRIMKLEKEDEI